MRQTQGKQLAERPLKRHESPATTIQNHPRATYNYLETQATRNHWWILVAFRHLRSFIKGTGCWGKHPSASRCYKLYSKALQCSVTELGVLFAWSTACAAELEAPEEALNSLFRKSSKCPCVWPFVVEFDATKLFQTVSTYLGSNRATCLPFHLKHQPNSSQADVFFRVYFRSWKIQRSVSLSRNMVFNQPERKKEPPVPPPREQAGRWLRVWQAGRLVLLDLSVHGMAHYETLKVSPKSSAKEIREARISGVCTFCTGVRGFVLPNSVK